jgi:hypothetical protein
VPVVHQSSTTFPTGRRTQPGQRLWTGQGSVHIQGFHALCNIRRYASDTELHFQWTVPIETQTDCRAALCIYSSFMYLVAREIGL